MVTGRANLLKQGKVHMNVEGLGLKAGEAVGDDLEPFTDSVEMFEPLLQAEVAQVVGDELIAQEAGELLILFQEYMFPLRTENELSVFDLTDHPDKLSL
jgi:hypothetical protein